ncbi:vitamin K-dependent protein C [Galendromus occidentalis]|uniref:Vitamin K-dependent protein C n=1 Tax=Galendromus occidentalis TaxID=34638 RepID=A0AAJ7L5A4_9ACAR|nr:vitamin K-dependent protein C [Galendromus occidentalis]
MSSTKIAVLIILILFSLRGDLLTNVNGLTVHDRILINANMFSRPARRLWAHKVYPRRFFTNSWWGKCHFKDTLSFSEILTQLGNLPKFDALDVSVCGRLSSVPRIINGTEAERQIFKYNAALVDMSRSGNKVFCGSSILSSRFVLTAAHCIEPYAKSIHKLRVSIGEYDLAVRSDKWRKIMKIADCQMHKEYTGKSPFRNDIALIKTSDEIVFNEFIGPICLPPVAQRPDFFEEQAIVSGWGLTNGSL